VTSAVPGVAVGWMVGASPLAETMTAQVRGIEGGWGRNP
jgi:hypothetical protein